MKLWAKIYRLRAMILTLLYHRSIIEELHDKVRWTENNACDIINLVEREGLRLTITPPQQSFGWIIRLKDEHSPIQGACISQMKIPPISAIERIIKDIKTYKKEQGVKK